MKIVHICLAASYVEGFGYQENIITKLHAEMGNEVSILTSELIFNSKYERVPREKKDYINSSGIHVIALTRSTRYGLYSRFNDFNGVFEKLTTLKPDIIFVHGGQFVSLKDVLKYCNKNRDVKLYIDQHGDYYNTRVDTWKTKIAQKVIYGHWMRKAVKYTEKFWGVTPWRCQYLHEVYRIPQKKIGLLLMGGDDELIHFEQMPQLRNDIRTQLNIEKDDFVLITGGKIDKTKNIHMLMQAVKAMDIDKIKLIVFGQPNDEMEPIIGELADDKHIRFLGWIASEKAYDYYLASDLAVFPGTHSVLWEQACACGIPGLFKDWTGMHHVDVGGNAGFLYHDSIAELSERISDIYNHPDKYSMMKKIAMEKGVKTFSYRDIAKRAIEIHD